MAPDQHSKAPWIAPGEAAPFEVENADGRGRVILTCDHASARIPSRLGSLGLAPADRERHVAWDIGAAAVARRLSRLLDAPLALSGYSRLVVDCNRPLDEPDAFATRSEDVRIEANEALSADERAGRADAFFWPYHDRVHRLVGSRTAGGRAPVVVSVHSFTPVYHGRARAWHIGALHRWDSRLAGLMMRALRADGALHVGDNEPYAVALDTDYTIPVHAERRGLPSVLLEIRQDLIATDAGQQSWAERLAAILAGVLADPSLDSTGVPAPDVREPRFA